MNNLQQITDCFYCTSRNQECELYTPRSKKEGDVV